MSFSWCDSADNVSHISPDVDNSSENVADGANDTPLTEGQEYNRNTASDDEAASKRVKLNN